MSDPGNSSSKPETIDKLRFAVDGAFAMLAGMELDKRREVPRRAIDEAIRRKRRFEADPGLHTHREE